MNRILFGLMAVALIGGSVAASAEGRVPDNIRINWADTWKSSVVEPGHIAALASYEEVSRDSPRLIAAFKGGAYLPGEVFVSNSSVVSGRSVGIRAPVTHAPLAADAVAAPEIDPTSAAAGLTLLLGGMAILRGRRVNRDRGVSRGKMDAEPLAARLQPHRIIFSCTTPRRGC
jgi:hypothetical protein